MAFIGLHSIVKGQDRQEFGRWLGYHRCSPRWMRTDGGEVLLVKIPIVCEHLAYDAAGLARCRIYDSRPRICRDHVCLKLKKPEEQPSYSGWD